MDSQRRVTSKAMRVRLYDSARKVMARLALETLSQTEGDGPVLDLGCGPGLIANYLERRQRRVIYGIDVGPKSIAAAARASSGHNRFAMYDGEHVPFPDGYFDAVLCLEVLEHIAFDREIIKEIVRVLRPGGRLLLSTPNAETVSLLTKPHHARHYDSSALASLLASAGLQIEWMTNRYHAIGSFIDRILLRLGGRAVCTEAVDDDALTVMQAQPGLIGFALNAYDRFVDPLITALVWREYVAKKSTPGASLVVLAVRPKSQ
jgi:2-polyprenyl-3-methyl-5-hydroxy-6-metoxy-1,4-benzoquinol methylase